MKTSMTEPLAVEDPSAPVADPVAEPVVAATRVLDPVAPTRVLETSLLEPEAWPLLRLGSAPQLDLDSVFVAETPRELPRRQQDERREPQPQSPPAARPKAPDAAAAAAAAPAAVPAAAVAPAAVPTPGRVPAVGDVVRGRYRLRRLIGQGGTGMVFEANDAWRLQPPDGDPRVALKMLKAEVARSVPRFTAFQREFQHLQALSHPNIVRVHDFDRDGEQAFFTMEFLSGAQLGELIAQRRGRALPRALALSILRDVGAAVAHAHARGIVHGDLNPANILVSGTGQVRVLDFGASNQFQAEPWISRPDDPPRVATRPWASCQVLERGVPVPADDVFSLGCLAYLLLTGRHPFEDRSALQARGAKWKLRRPPGTTARTWWALRAGLRFEREQRPRDAGQWLALWDFKPAAPQLPSLADLVMVQPESAHPWRWAVGAGLAAAVLAFSWWAGAHTDLPQRAAQAQITAPSVPHTP